MSAMRSPRPQRIGRLLEKDIQATMTEYLELDDWRPLRTDPTSDRKRGKGFGEVGMADHLYIRYVCAANGNLYYANEPSRAFADVLWIEYKKLGGIASSAQKAWHQRERSRGALTLIVGEDCPATIEGIVVWYSASGLQRRHMEIGSVRAKR